jgi:uncharacterized protein with HEPN domain
MKQSKILIDHIIEALDKIETYIQGYSKDDFVNDNKTQDAVIRQLEIIGEASSKLEDSFTKSYPEIPWRAIKNFHNRLIHEYWFLDLEIIWNVVTKRVAYNFSV